MIRLVLILGAMLAGPVAADTVVAARAVRAGAVLGLSDISLEATETPGALTNPADALGQEARVNLYPGRPIRAEDLGPPAVIDRNQTVTLVYRRGGLLIMTEGRALDRAGIGDRVSVMNLASRVTISGIVEGPGTVRVGPPEPSS